MTEFDPGRLRFIELRGDGSKLPAKEWGGYSQDFENADRVYDYDDIQVHPNDNWGVVDIEDPPHGSMALLIFDVDVHKAPDDFDADRLRVPTNTLVTRSQNGGFHVYWAVNGYERGELSESDFEMTHDPGFDIDIRGSVVSHHVVAPSEINGCGGPYEIVNNDQIRATFKPSEAAQSISIDGQPLLEYNPDSSLEPADYDWEMPGDPPEEMPTCYFRGLELRKKAPDDHPNTHKVNVLTALCGLAAGYEPETIADHMLGEWSPWDGEADRGNRDKTEYQVSHLAESMERGGYSPPAESTLREYGLLEPGEHCEGCPIDYHGPRDNGEQLDVLDESRGGRGEGEAVAGADGGAQTDSAAGDRQGRSRRFQSEVTDAIAEWQEEVIPAKTARHRIARALTKHYNFVYPEDEVRGWRSTLYVFDEAEGIYEPRGERFIQARLEEVAGDFTTNQVTKEIVEKVKRMTSERGRAFETPPERLVVGNGILDLHTGECVPYDPKEYHRTKIDVDWNPDAGEPNAIDEFLHDIVDESDVPTLYRLIAHSLYKEYATEKAAMLIGSGQNGKSVFLDLVEQFLGGYNVTHRALQEFDENEFAANQLAGKLANVHPDMGDATVKDMSTFKKLTGRDTMLANVKYEKPIKFENYATLIFAANEMPVFSEDNHAVWRRWVYVDFPYTFSAHDPDAKDPEPKRKLLDRLTSDQELEALLYRCQQEIQEWYNGREWFADAMRPEDVRDKMKKAAEPIYAFASACLEADNDEDSYLRKDQVRECYREYADAEDLPKIPANQFSERLLALRDYDIESSRRRENGSRPRVFENIRFSSRGRQLLDLDVSDDGQGAVDDDYEQGKAQVMAELRDMVEENDNQPVSEEGVIWRATGRGIGKATAERHVKELKKEGSIYVSDGDLLPTSH